MSEWKDDARMTATTTANWFDTNQRYLTAAVANLRALLEARGAGDGNSPDRDASASPPSETAEMIAAAMDALPGLEAIRMMFGLSPFERDVLLLCAAMELDAAIAPLCATLNGDARCAYPTFGLALAALPDAHWSALAPTAPLRHWRLIEVSSGTALTLSPLRIDERILHYLTGIRYLDARLAGMVHLLPSVGALVPSHRAIAERIEAAWTRAVRPPLPCIQLCGADNASLRAIVVAACDAVGIQVHALPAEAIPTNGDERSGFTRLWEREATLGMGALLIDAMELDHADSSRVYALTALIERLNAPLLVICRDRQATGHRPTVTFDVNAPESAEQDAVWRAALGDLTDHLNGHVDRLVSQFTLNSTEIAAAWATARGAADGAAPDRLGELLWDACRVQSRTRMDDLAQRITSPATWDDLVLPTAQRETLRAIAMHVRQRTTVYQHWGFAGKGARGLGITALFAGASGTGKTMAAEVLANELRLDLYRIDLSAVVNKYIGETEKNLRRVFDAAEGGGAILLFDEADALFGKRSEVRDSHDRYANIEVSYLLQRMEAYRGLAILTTNLKSALDTAFMRRLRFVVPFPFPDVPQRAEIWRRAFPAATPTDGLDPARLAQLNVAGGNIKNIALNAAFLAAEAREPVRMAHLLRAAHVEYAKIEKALTAGETAGWLA